MARKVKFIHIVSIHLSLRPIFRARMLNAIVLNRGKQKHGGFGPWRFKKKFFGLR